MYEIFCELSAATMAATPSAAYDQIVIDNLFMPNEINQRDEHF